MKRPGRVEGILKVRDDEQCKKIQNSDLWSF